MKPTAFLDQWLDCDVYLMGTIMNHPRQHEFKATMQATSKIVNRPDKILSEGDVVETLNTKYVLGSPMNFGGTD